MSAPRPADRFLTAREIGTRLIPVNATIGFTQQVSFDDDRTYSTATRFRWEHAMASTTMNSASDVQSDSAARTLVQNWWLFTLRGILGIIFGGIALIFPGPTMLSLVLLFSAYMLVDGVFGIISAVRAIRRKEDRWGLLIFEGLLNI